MKLTVPEYYEKFKCTAAACRHNCCNGWEIDIDEDSLGHYMECPGEIGSRLRDNIDVSGESACFRLGEDERCPFLNERNLCSIILELGEEHLCQICTDHPRFRNFFSDREELGLGLCCEAAAELILGREEPFREVVLSDDGGAELLTELERDVLCLRRELISAAQDRTKPISERVSSFELILPKKTSAEWADIFYGLERMDREWDEKLDELRSLTDIDAEIPQELDTAFEQLLVYFLWRHIPGASDACDARARAAFALLSYTVIRRIFLAEREKNNCAGLKELCECARLYSAEIEYSDENTYFLIDMMK